MKYKLSDLFDIENIQELFDNLNNIYPFPSSIIDNDGNILTATGWQDICTKFHRKNKKSNLECIKSDKYITYKLQNTSEYILYKCPHGLIDCAVPIVIDGVHYGNFFTGQFFLEPPDIDFFKAQAKKFNFDETLYLKAVNEVPIWSKEQLDNYITFIKKFTEILGHIGLKNLKEIENREIIKNKENELINTNIQLKKVNKELSEAIEKAEENEGY
jgi:ligand-binding sensor protein